MKGIRPRKNWRNWSCKRDPANVKRMGNYENLDEEILTPSICTHSIAKSTSKSEKKNQCVHDPFD